MWQKLQAWLESLNEQISENLDVDLGLNAILDGHHICDRKPFDLAALVERKQHAERVAPGKPHVWVWDWPVRPCSSRFDGRVKRDLTDMETIWLKDLFDQVPWSGGGGLQMFDSLPGWSLAHLMAFLRASGVRAIGIAEVIGHSYTWVGYVINRFEGHAAVGKAYVLMPGRPQY
ncbi:hypothetical protein D5S17_32725 [Pseudonocardiaceae bacterium YIM PH 21723]|nr:hypothetical protein D5S17_32725 [Pseudonocardiaceae bacterium YIM PH 21723]